MLLNVPDATLKPYQRLQNMSAKVTLNTNKYASSTESLIALHWLPVRARIIFKKSNIGTPVHIRQCLRISKEPFKKKQSKCSLRNYIHNTCDLEVPFNKRKTFGDRSFSGGAPPSGMHYLTT